MPTTVAEFTAVSCLLMAISDLSRHRDNGQPITLVHAQPPDANLKAKTGRNRQAVAQLIS